jgi:hypothetical protein
LFTSIARPVSDIYRFNAKINLETVSMRANFGGRGERGGTGTRLLAGIVG